jgi:hypothetical protein
MDLDQSTTERRSKRWDNARARAIYDAEEAGLEGAEREAFIVERAKIYYGLLKRSADAS